jgi:DNA-binding NarL/FixJ family response regulator
MAVKTVIVSDVEAYRRGLKQIFADTEEFEVVSEASHISQLLRLLREYNVDQILLDGDLKGKGSLFILHKVRLHLDDLTVVVLSSINDDDFICDHIIMGAANVLSKYLSDSELVSQLIDINKKGFALPLRVTRLIAARNGKLPTIQGPLTDREREIFLLLEKHLTEAQIAVALKIKETTVHSHKRKMFLKTDSHKVSQLILKVRKHGLI